MPLYIRYPHHIAILHQVSPSHCHLTSGIPIRYPFLSYFPGIVPLSTVCAHLCRLNIKWAHRSVP
ncbi:unnamed protein product [Staurois parvus]|uniref:Uncharacterized protein n=1 Tax=Staurois parvus TaxID=386267 RepID=A0ABN9G983_9NEOB|nr:unnamed protein product [Staurois parvus]